MPVTPASANELGEALGCIMVTTRSEPCCALRAAAGHLAQLLTAHGVLGCVLLLRDLLAACLQLRPAANTSGQQQCLTTAPQDTATESTALTIALPCRGLHFQLMGALETAQRPEPRPPMPVA